MENNYCVLITDYVEIDCKKDVSDGIQRAIDENPNKTIFFPDGEYLVNKPILTPADPTKSVSLKLADFAVLRATDSWRSDEAIVRLGAKDPANDIFTPGSNYGLEGGIIDCRKLANGISIDGGRETYVRNTSIKSAVCGLHIKYGINSGSSDSDIFGVNITGTGEKNSIGVLVEGLDNTFTNMRIGNVFVGVEIRSGGNIFRNIHPLYYVSSASYPYYEESIGFLEAFGRNNWFDFCYSDQFAIGFKTVSGGSIYSNCFCYWYSTREKKHTAFKCNTAFSGRISGLLIGGKEPEGYENRFSEGLTLTEDAVIRDVTVNGKLLSSEELLK